MAKIFISYRRDDSAGHAGRLYDRLIDHFGPDDVFMDIDTIKPGRDFLDEVRQAVGACDGLVAIIGQEWLTISDSSGVPRLKNPEDIVNLEITTALERGIRVIPVLVQGARMPIVTDFPESLKDLAQRNAQEISDRSFNSDAQSLIEALEAPEPEAPESNNFIGRQQEMEVMRGALDLVLSGRGQMVMLAGHPGIGKTRLAQEITSRAESLGAQALWGRCYEGEGAPPYWPWVQAIRSYVLDVDPEQLRSEMGAGAADIAEVVSDVRERLPGLPTPPRLEPEQDRFRLFDSITTFLKRASRRNPVVLVLDDLHWADHPSLLLLEFVARELDSACVMIIGTYRDVELSRQHPLSHTLGELNRERSFQRVLLRGLDQNDVARFFELASDVTPPPGMLEAVHRQTEGNPFFVTEVVRLLVQEGELTEDSSTSSGRAGEADTWSVRIPEGVREVIGRRLDRLSERCNQTLTVASVLGREFTLEQLRPLIDDLSDDRLLEVLEEALGAKVLEELPRVAGHYQFTHALIQETLLEDLSATRRVRLHARIAEALEELYGDEVEAHAAALAYHLAAVGTLDSLPKMIYYSLKAGEWALATYAYEEALDHFERGLAAAQGREMDSHHADLLLGLAKSKAATGQSVQVQDAWNSLSQAFDYHAQAGNAAQVSEIALYPFPLEVGILATDAVELIARALTIVPVDSRDAGHLQARYGNALGLLQGDYLAAQAAFKRSLETAQTLDDPSLEMGTLAAAAGVDWFHLHWQEAIEKSARAIELGERLDEPVHQWVAHLWAVNSLAALGRSEEARQRAEAIVPVAENLRHRNEVALAHALNARVSHLTGDWEASRRFSDRGLALSSGHTQALVVRIMVEYDSGNNTQGDEYLERLMESVRSTAPGPNLPRAYLAQVVPMVARITGRKLGPESMDSETQAIISSASATPFAATLARLGLATTAVTRDDPDGASEQYSALTALRGTALVISVDHLLGLLARTMGQMNDAKAHFEDALAFCRRAGYRPELAWTSFDYAETLLPEANGHAPPQEEIDLAMELLDDALNISRQLGMRPLLERVLARRESLSA